MWKGKWLKFQYQKKTQYIIILLINIINIKEGNEIEFQ